ncbi:hypothetical protein AMTRI_Chr11g154120 [Amborella trichopoda]
MAVSAALGLAYVNDTTRLQNVIYYRKILDELLSFDWGIHALFWQSSTSQRGTSLRGCFASFAILKIIPLQERQSIVALSFCFVGILPLFWPWRVCRGRERSPLLARGWLSKTGPQLLRTMILSGNVTALFHYALNLGDFMVSLLLQLKISCPIGKITPLILINKSNQLRTYQTLVWKMLKLNWLDGWPLMLNSRRTLIRNRRLNRQTYCLFFTYFCFFEHE